MKAAERDETRADALRRAFDLSFAALPATETEPSEDLLAIRVASDPYAIRLRDITGVVTNRPIVALPTGRADVLGLAGIRGGLVPVFSLLALLGYTCARDDDARWMVLCAAGDTVALAFTDLECYLRVPQSAIFGGDDAPAPDHTLATLPTSHASSRGAAREIARTERGALPIISIPLIVATLMHADSSSRATKE